MAKDTKPIERVLHESVREEASKYVIVYGSLKTVLSAGIIAFGKLNPSQREELIVQIKGESRRKNTQSSESKLKTPREVLKDLVQTAKCLKSGPAIKITPSDEKLWDELRKIVEDAHEGLKKAKEG
jgi:hypothetical protein